MTESLAKAATTALLSLLSEDEDKVDLKEKVAMHLIETFDTHSKIDRVTVPAIRCVDVLFTGGAFDFFNLTVTSLDGLSKDYRTALSDKIRFECAERGTCPSTYWLLMHFHTWPLARIVSRRKESARLGLLAMMRNKFPARSSDCVGGFAYGA